MGAILLKIVNLLKDEELPRVGPAGAHGTGPVRGRPATSVATKDTNE